LIIQNLPAGKKKLFSHPHFVAASVDVVAAVVVVFPLKRGFPSHFFSNYCESSFYCIYRNQMKTVVEPKSNFVEIAAKISRNGRIREQNI
jgi:hypothetical protein